MNFSLDTLNSIILAPKKLILLISGILLIAVILEIWTVNRLSTTGDQIERIEQLSSDLQLQNDILKDQIARKSSLSEISQKANQLGFNRNTNPQYILPEGLALR